MNARSIAAALVSAVLVAAPFAAAAAESTAGAITVKANMARILRINTPAATVVIGNPGVADVTIQDPRTLVLTGKSYGQTNLIVLDSLGNPIADTLVEVIQSQSDLVTVFQGQARTSMACAPKCEPMIMLGDDVGYTKNNVDSVGLIEGIAE